MAGKCYDCIYKRNVPGNAHIACEHPLITNNPVNGMMLAVIILAEGKLPDSLGWTISGNRHGIEQGWFYWPQLFDPVWMESQCNKFEGIKDAKETES